MIGIFVMIAVFIAILIVILISAFATRQRNTTFPQAVFYQNFVDSTTAQ